MRGCRIRSSTPTAFRSWPSTEASATNFHRPSRHRSMRSPGSRSTWAAAAAPAFGRSARRRRCRSALPNTARGTRSTGLPALLSTRRRRPWIPTAITSKATCAKPCAAPKRRPTIWRPPKQASALGAESARIAQLQFKNGLISLTDATQAERDNLSAQNDLVNARANYIDAIVRERVSVGNSDPLAIGDFAAREITVAKGHGHRRGHGSPRSARRIRSGSPQSRPARSQDRYRRLHAFLDPTARDGGRPASAHRRHSRRSSPATSRA